MNQDNHKKIIIFVLILFLINIFTPTSVRAQALNFSGSILKNIAVGQSIPITIATSDKKAGVEMQLQAWNTQRNGLVSWINISPAGNCTTTAPEGSCLFSVVASQAGQFELWGIPVLPTYTSTTSSGTITVEPVGTCDNIINSAPQLNVTKRYCDFLGGKSDPLDPTPPTTTWTQNLSPSQSPPGQNTGSPGRCIIDYSTGPPITQHNWYQQQCIDERLKSGVILTTWTQYNSITNPPPTGGQPPQQPTAPPIPVKNNFIYQFLEPLPRLSPQIDTSQDSAWGTYLDVIINLIIGIAAVLAVVMIVVGGIEYMTTELVSQKAEGKNRILQAIFGLLLALGSWVILNTINPKLLDVTIKISPTSIQGMDVPQVPVSGKYCRGKYDDGQVWTGTRTTLPNNVTTNYWPNDCDTVGQQYCTSIKDLNSSIIERIRNACPNCDLIITGGTECWLHSANSTHGVNSPTIDLRATSSLTRFLTQGSAVFPTGNTITNHPKLPGLRFQAERVGQTPQTTAEHWHVE